MHRDHPPPPRAALDRWVRVDVGVGDGVLSDGESGGCLDGVPVLLSEGVGPLLQALLALGQSLVLANRHVCGMSRSCRLVGVVGDVVSSEVSTLARPGWVCCEKAARQEALFSSPQHFATSMIGPIPSLA